MKVQFDPDDPGTVMSVVEITGWLPRKVGVQISASYKKVRSDYVMRGHHIPVCVIIHSSSDKDPVSVIGGTEDEIYATLRYDRAAGLWFWRKVHGE
jgi:hypothetical protein